MPSPDVDALPPWQAEARAIARLAGVIASPHFPTGDLAALRRLDVEQPDRAAFWRLLSADVPAEVRRVEAAETAWAAVLHGMALMAPNHHRQGAAPGRVLAEAGLADARFERLLRLRDALFREALARTCRFLGAKATPLDWVQLGHLVLAGDGDHAERLRRRLARQFYDHAPAKETTP